jgi:hypothetical protein
VARVMAWTGSRWSDVSVWTGSAWKHYVHDKFDANVYAYDMNSGANGWVQEYGAGGETPANNWSNVHIYGNDFGNNAYGTSMQLRRKLTDSLSLRPGDTVHVQASLLIQKLAGSQDEGGTFRASVEFGTGLGDPTAAVALSLTPGWYGWATLDSRSGGTGYTVPDNGGKPYPVTLTECEVSCSMAGPAVGSNGTYRFFCDWYQLIDQNGNLLKRLTANRVPVLSAWDGSAWV